MKGLTQAQIAEIYDVPKGEVSQALHGVPAIGRTKDKHPSRLYDEQRAGHAIAQMFRWRSDQAVAKAQYWAHKANEAERKCSGLALNKREAEDEALLPGELLDHRFSGLITED